MAKIAISLPDDVLEEIETARKDRGQSRSEFVRKALDAYLRRGDEDRRRYIEGYKKFPETAEEMAMVEAAAEAVFANNPWTPSDIR